LDSSKNQQLEDEANVNNNGKNQEEDDEKLHVDVDYATFDACGLRELLVFLVVSQNSLVSLHKLYLSMLIFLFLGGKIAPNAKLARIAAADQLFAAKNNKNGKIVGSSSSTSTRSIVVNNNNNNDDKKQKLLSSKKRKRKDSNDTNVSKGNFIVVKF
jgi:hypothetical protein